MLINTQTSKKKKKKKKKKKTEINKDINYRRT